MPQIFNISEYTPIRKRLRSTMTPQEIRLWVRLKGHGLLGHKFRRQHGIGQYVIDFYCDELKLAVELDGGQHYHPY